MAQTHLIPRVTGGNGTGVITPSGPAPNVQSFAAGTLQPSAEGDTEATFTPVMHWDPLNRAMTFDWGAALPSDTSNFKEVQIAVRRPAPSGTPGEYEWIFLGDPIPPSEFHYNSGVRVVFSHIGIEFSTVPATPETWAIIAVSFNAAGDPNTDGDGHPTGPSVNLTTLAPTTAVNFNLPTQPGAGDWFTTDLGLNRNDQTGENIERIRVTVTLNASDVTYFSVYAHKGSTIPTDPTAYGDSIWNQTQAASGSTVMEFFLPVTNTSDPWRILVAAGSANYVADAKYAAGPAKLVTIAALGLPAQPDSITASAHTTWRGGVHQGYFVVSWPKPSDPQYYAGKVYKIQSNAAGAPIKDPTNDANWDDVGNGETGFDQSTENKYWNLPDGTEYWVLRVRSISRAKTEGGNDNIENLTGYPTTVVTISASDGLDLGTALLSSVGSGIEISSDGKIKVKNGSGIALDSGGNVTVNEGVGLEIDGSGFLKVKTAGAVSADSSGVFIPGGAITNSLLGALAVAESNMQDNAVTDRKVASLNVSKLFATTVKIGTALIANAAITNALIGNLAVGTANIQNAAITDALVANLAVGKLIAGTAIFTGDVVLQRSGSNAALTLSSSGVAISDSVSVVQITSSGVLIKNQSGSLSQMLLSSTGAAITNSSGTGAIKLDQSGQAIFTNNSNVSTVINGNSIATTSITTIAISSNGYDTAFGGTYKLFGALVINSSGAFVGAGVNCPSNGVGALGFTTYFGGSPYTGDSHDVQCQVFLPAIGANPAQWYICRFVDHSGGPAYQFLRMRGGLHTGIWDGSFGSFTI